MSLNSLDPEKIQLSVSKKRDETVEPEPPSVTYPEGSWQGWTTLLGAWIVQFSTFGYVNSFGVYQGRKRTTNPSIFVNLDGVDFYVREYLTNKSSSQISWIGSVQLFLILALGFFTGRLFDKGYFYHLVISGTVLSTLCHFMLSLTHEKQYHQVLLSQGFGVGVGFGLTYVPALGVVSHYFNRRRTLALGILASGSSSGGLLHPIMLNHLIHGRLGFHAAVRASAAMNFGLLVIAIALMKTRLPVGTFEHRSLVFELKNYIRDVPYVLSVLGAFFVLCGLVLPSFFIQLFAIKHGIDPGVAFYLLTTMNCANLVGRIVPNIFARRMGVFNMMVACTAIMSAVCFTMISVRNAAGAFVFSVFFGFFSGANISLTPPIITLIANDVGEIGLRLGFCFATTGFAGLIGAPVAGALLTTDYHWWRLVLFAGLCIALGAVLTAIAREIMVRRKGTQRI